jgi:ABC-2 type transport system ATP-binding protein
MPPTTDAGLAIDLHDVAKVYKGRVHALQGIEMKVARGEVFGLLGPNGAGKSTLVKIMMTVIRPTRAAGFLLGQPVGHKPTLQKVGYLPENHRFPKYLTGRQTLEFFGALAKVDRPTRKRRAGELLDVVGMTDWGDKKTAAYSKGMMQRVGIAQALMGDPDLVVLDEPTDGVDPVGRRDIRDVLNRIREQGKTVFINSHLLSELEMLCDRVAIMVKGRVAKHGTINDLTSKSQRYEVELEVGPTELAGLPDRVARALGVAFQAVPRQASPFSARGGTPPAGMAMPPSMGMPPGMLPPMPAMGMPPSTGMPPPLSAPSGGAPPLPEVPPLAGPPPLRRATLPDGIWAELDGAVLSLGTADARRAQPIVDAVRAADLTVRRLAPVRQSLEDLFMEAVTDPTTGSAATPGADRPGFARHAGGRP